MKTIYINTNTTVKELQDIFAKYFNLTLKVYNKNRLAADSDRLDSIKSTTNELTEFTINEKWSVKYFADFMMEKFGLKVKVFTCDAWVAVLDGITIEDAGKIKKGAVIADMIPMLKQTEGTELTKTEEKNNEPEYEKPEDYEIKDNLQTENHSLIEKIIRFFKSL